MGFKRTTEGRVFFQGSENTANDTHRETGRDNAREPGRESQGGQGGVSQHTQLQILTLLKALNEKLKATQTERNKMRRELELYRELIQALGNKTESNERATLELERKLENPGRSVEARAAQAEKMAQETFREMEETRRLLLDLEEKAEQADKRQIEFERRQMEQADKIASGSATYKTLVKRLNVTEQKNDEISGKVEEALSQQSRLLRKIEQAVEERARFMRKIERIEETVIQTRDAMNAKAMVLLTDQNVSGHAAPIMSDPVLTALPKSLTEEGAQAQPYTQTLPSRPGESIFTRWKNNLNTQTAAVALVLVLGVLSGLIFSELKSREPQSETISQISMPRDAAVPPANDLTPPSPAPAEEEQSWQVPDENMSASSGYEDPAPAGTLNETDTAVPTPPKPQDYSAVDDIGTLDLNDEEKLQKLLETDPDALAAGLNKIEPGEDEPETIEPPPAASAPTKLASLPPETAPVKEAPVPAAPMQKVQQKLPERKPLKLAGIDKFSRPDPSLPDAVKAVEEKAFAGVPEAEHDLAAVYTAGHSGAKQDYARAAYWFEKAADAGVANARYNLGVLYHQGLGVKPDISQAIYWYTKAAELGHPEAQYNLGIAYIEGIGVQYDPVTAANFFKRAADQNVMEAAYNLGLIYENGLLGQAKPDEALMWYKTASDQGSPEAKAALGQLAKTLGIGLDDVNRVAGEMKKAQEQSKAAPPPAASRQSSGDDVKKKSPVNRTVEAEPLTEPAKTVTGFEDITTSNFVPPVNDRQRLLMQIQEHLMDMGLYPGPADGAGGPLTEDAIRSYQAQNNLPADGRPSNELLMHMVAGAAAGAP